MALFYSRCPIKLKQHQAPDIAAARPAWIEQTSANINDMIHTGAALTVTCLKHKVLEKTRGSGYGVRECFLPSKRILSTKRFSVQINPTFLGIQRAFYLSGSIYVASPQVTVSVTGRKPFLLSEPTDDLHLSPQLTSLGTRKSPAIRKDGWHFISESSQHFTFFSLLSAVVGKPEHLFVCLFVCIVLVTFFACVICAFGIRTEPELVLKTRMIW